MTRKTSYTSYRNWLKTHLLDFAHNYTINPKQTLKDMQVTSNESSVWKLVLPKLNLIHKKNKELMQTNSHLNQEVTKLMQTNYQLKTTIHKQNFLIRDIIKGTPAESFHTQLEELVNVGL